MRPAARAREEMAGSIANEAQSARLHFMLPREAYKVNPDFTALHLTE